MFETIAYSGLGMFVTTVHPSWGLYNPSFTQPVKDNLPFQNPCWLLLIIFSSFFYSEMDSKMMFPIIFPGSEMKLISL